MLIFNQNYIEEHDAASQRRYMQFNLKKPPTLHPREMLTGFETMKNYLKLFPTKVGKGIIYAAKRLSEEELVGFVM